MAEGYEPFNYEKQRARIAAGFKGKTGQFENPSNGPKLTFVEAVDPIVVSMFKPVATNFAPTIDPWGSRRR